MTWSANFFLRKFNYFYFCSFVLIVVIFHTSYKSKFNTNENDVFEEAAPSPNLEKIKFIESELIQETNSTPTSGVLLGRYDGYGLGNHLFFYAISYTLSRKLRLPLLLPPPPENHKDNSKNSTDRGFVLDHFTLPKGSYVDPKGIQEVYIATCEMAENVSLIPSEILNQTKYFKIGSFYLDAWYFKEYEKELQQIKVKVESPSEGYVKWKELIMNTDWPIAVHVRRGDIENQYWSAPVEYFQEALRTMKKEAPHNLKKQIFIFSDDMRWAKKSLASFQTELKWTIHFVSGSFGGLTNLEELDLMIKCKSIVISNSTFSWWAAYLMKVNEKFKKIVIRPQFNATKHTNDHLGVNGMTRYDYAIGYPSDWIAIDT